jgi:RNA polymerase sigma-70 factor (ECF subfamily)
MPMIFEPSRPSITDLYRRHRWVVVARCRRLLGDGQAAEDAAQETFLRACRYPHQLPAADEVLRWLNRIATNYCLNQLRDGQRREQLLRSAGPPPQLSTAEPGGEIADRDLVRRLISSVPASVGRTALLHHVAGLGQAEVAAWLGVSRRTVANRIADFRRRAPGLVGLEPH